MTPWVTRLLIANVVMFVLAQPGTTLFRLLWFVPTNVLATPWSPVTYMFLHGGFWHILFNMLMLYFFGPRLEARLGSRDFLFLYFLSGIAGAALSYLFVFLTGPSAIVGASGAIFGVLFGFAKYWPHERIFIWGILPVPARVMVLGMAALSIYSGITGAGGNIAHFAHLGGFVGAWGYLKIRERRSRTFQRKATPGADPSTLERISGRAARAEKKWEEIRVDELHEINRQEVERIRAKIDRHGAGALTPDERAFMNRMAE